MKENFDLFYSMEIEEKNYSTPVSIDKIKVVQYRDTPEQYYGINGDLEQIVNIAPRNYIKLCISYLVIPQKLQQIAFSGFCDSQGLPFNITAKYIAKSSEYNDSIITYKNCWMVKHYSPLVCDNNNILLRDVELECVEIKRI